jgi:gliding-associated putative ABC transporter substrate-binding component GldG
MSTRSNYLFAGIAEAVIIALILIIINWIGYRFWHRFDMTENQRYTLSQATIEILNRMEDPVTAEFFVSQDLPQQAIRYRRTVRDWLEEYVKYGSGNFKLKITDPGDDTDEKERAEKLGVFEMEMQAFENDAMSIQKAYFGLVLNYEDSTEVISAQELTDPGALGHLEYAISSRLVRLTQDEKPKVGLYIGASLGQQQQQQPQFTGINQILGGPDGFYEVVRINPETDETLPDDLSGLIVAGAFGISETMKYSIDQFIMNGGQVLFALDPKMEINQQQLGETPQAYPALQTIEDQLASYGVDFKKKLIADGNCAMVMVSQVGMGALMQYPLFPRIGPTGLNSEVPAVADIESMLMPYCSPLNRLPVEGTTWTPLASTSEASFTISSPFELTPDQDWAFLQTSTEETGPFDVAVMVQGELPSAFDEPPAPPQPTPAEDGSEQVVETPFDASEHRAVSSGSGYIVVLASLEAISDEFIGQNALFLANVMDMLLMGDELMGIRSAPVTARPLKSFDTAEQQKRSAIRWANVLGIPVLLGIIGLLVWFSKRQRRAAIARYYQDKAGA